MDLGLAVLRVRVRSLAAFTRSAFGAALLAACGAKTGVLLDPPSPITPADGGADAETVDAGVDAQVADSPADAPIDVRPSLLCPGSETARPLNTHTLDARGVYPGVALSYHWTVECPATVSPCPAPDDPDAIETEIYFVSSGSYAVELDVVTEAGETLTCRWTILVESGGLRVELNWDTRGAGNGNTDVDLHLHRKSVPEGTMSAETAFFDPNDCYYGNCKGSYYDPTVTEAWGLPATMDLSACANAPQNEGAAWRGIGTCFNPRLDVDVISCDPDMTDASNQEFCAPENINIDDPPLGQPYRVMVNYYSDAGHFGTTHPTVAVYCAGVLAGTFGTDPAIVLRNGGSGYDNNDTWLVTDVVFRLDGSGQLGCDLLPLNQMVVGADFGPAWSL